MASGYAFQTPVLAPSPADRSQLCAFQVARNDSIKAARAGRREPAFEFWSIVVGVAPPVPGALHRNANVPGELTQLSKAHACFRGIKRPLAEDDDGDSVVAYVLRPAFFYQYDPNMVSVAWKVPVPRGLLFIVYVRLFEASTEPPAGTMGIVTHWGFVEADKADPRLPINYRIARYRTRLW